MNYNAEKNNKVYVYGEIVSDAEFSHEVYGEGFYEFYVKVMRLSGQADILPVTVSERIMTEDMKRARSSARWVSSALTTNSTTANRALCSRCS